MTLDSIVSDALDALLPNDTPQQSTATIRAAVEELAQRAYAEGRGAALRDLRTTDQAAAELGVSVQRVRQLAHELEAGLRVGRDWVFSVEDIASMRAREDGRRTRHQRPVAGFTAGGAAEIASDSA